MPVTEWTKNRPYEWEADGDSDDDGLRCDTEEGHVLSVYPGAWSLSGAGRYWHWSVECGYMSYGHMDPPEWIEAWRRDDESGGTTLIEAKWLAQRCYERWLVREQVEIDIECEYYDSLGDTEAQIAEWDRQQNLAHGT